MKILSLVCSSNILVLKTKETILSLLQSTRTEKERKRTSTIILSSYLLLLTKKTIKDPFKKINKDPFWSKIYNSQLDFYFCYVHVHPAEWSDGWFQAKKTVSCCTCTYWNCRQNKVMDGLQDDLDEFISRVNEPTSVHAVWLEIKLPWKCITCYLRHSHYMRFTYIIVYFFSLWSIKMLRVF